MRVLGGFRGIGGILDMVGTILTDYEPNLTTIPTLKKIKNIGFGGLGVRGVYSPYYPLRALGP